MPECLKRYKDIFAWSHKEIPWVNPKEMKHCLNIDPSYPPVIQKHKKFAPEMNKVINDEVDRLLEMDAIEPCQYPEWLPRRRMRNRGCV